MIDHLSSSSICSFFLFMVPRIQKKATYKHVCHVDTNLLLIYTLLYFLKRDVKSVILFFFVELGIEPRNWHTGGRCVTRKLYPQPWALVFQIAFPGRMGKGAHCDSKKQFCFCLIHAGFMSVFFITGDRKLMCAKDVHCHWGIPALAIYFSNTRFCAKDKPVS